jgi:hypothetical protein
LDRVDEARGIKKRAVERFSVPCSDMSMSDTHDPTKPPSPPPLPEIYQFPIQLLQAWTEIPEVGFVEPKLTRADFDKLLIGLLKSFQAQSALETTLVHWSNQRIKEADAALYDSRRLNIEAQNNIRQFFAALMISATQSQRS